MGPDGGDPERFPFGEGEFQLDAKVVFVLVTEHGRVPQIGLDEAIGSTVTQEPAQVANDPSVPVRLPAPPAAPASDPLPVLPAYLLNLAMNVQIQTLKIFGADRNKMWGGALTQKPRWLRVWARIRTAPHGRVYPGSS